MLAPLTRAIATICRSNFMALFVIGRPSRWSPALRASRRRMASSTAARSSKPSTRMQAEPRRVVSTSCTSAPSVTSNSHSAGVGTSTCSCASSTLRTRPATRSRAYSTFSPARACRRSASGKISNERMVLSKATIPALLLPQLAHQIDRIHPAAFGRRQARAKTVEQFRQRGFVERFEIDDLELLEHPRSRLHARPSARTPHTDWSAEQVKSQTPRDGLRSNTRRQVLSTRLQVNIDRLVTAADLDDLAIERARLLHRTQFLLHVPGPAGKFDQLRFAADDAAHRVVFGEFVVKIPECFLRRLRASTVADLIARFVDFAPCDLVHTRGNTEAARLEFPKVDVLTVPQQFREARHVVGEARHRYRLWRERINIELINLFTGHEGAFLSVWIMTDSAYCFLASQFPIPRGRDLERIAAETDAILSANQPLTAYNEERSGAQRRR